jgi:hypothetical protein
MAPKTVGVAAVACLSIGWLAASLLSPPVARLQSRPTPRTTRPAAAPAAETFSEALRLKLERTTSAPIVRRNPFVFGTSDRSVPTAAAASGGAAVEDPPAEPLAPAVVTPPFVLAGIAVNTTAEGDVRTAVLSDGTNVHLAKAGDRVGIYSVVAVTADSVTLTETSGTTFVIRLR